jgi:hypothetical protein
VNRRRFLGFLGLGAAAVAAEQVIPFNRVWSFPKQIVLPGSLILPPGASARFIKVWDVREARLISRFDMAFGFGALKVPGDIKNALAVHNSTDRDQLWRPPADIPRELVAAVRQEADNRAHLAGQQIFGASMPEKFMMLYS